MSEPVSKPSRRTPKIVLGVLLGIIGIAVIAYAVDIMLTKDRVPRGTSVGGVDISLMSTEEATTALHEGIGGRLTEPVSVHAGELSAEFLPDQAGLGIDWDATVEVAAEHSWNPLTRLAAFFTTTEVPIESTVDGALLAPVLDDVAGQLYADPVNGAVWIEQGDVHVNDTVDGQEVDRADLEGRVTDDWLNPEGVNVEPQVIAAPITQDHIEEIASGPAETAVSEPFIVHGRDEVDGEIPVDRMGEVVSFPEDGNTLRTEINHEIAVEILAEQLAETEEEAQNAQISFVGGSRQITPEVDGTEIDWEETLTDLAEHLTGDASRDVDAVYTDSPATFTYADAENATFNEVMGQFTTGGFEAASGTNIRLTAQLVDGAVVAPGDVFSLNGYTGPRGAAQGFVESGIILNGRADTAVGGGISQFATTLYNAAYFAGLEDVAHTPHSYYISRYPAGREATVYEGAIDLQFRNTTPYPVMIRATADSSNVTVQLMGVNTYNVESVNNGRWATTQPNTVTVSGPECSPSSGAPGFTTSDTRIIRDLAGSEVSRETTTTIYDPSPIVRCD